MRRMSFVWRHKAPAKKLAEENESNIRLFNNIKYKPELPRLNLRRISLDYLSF
jgi:hypothetical protein